MIEYPATISITIRYLFIVASITGLAILGWEVYHRKASWRLLVGAIAAFLEVGIFYTFRVFGYPRDTVVTNWVSSAIHLSCLFLILLTTIVLSRCYNAHARTK
jgi:hypothetical protein